MRRPPEPEPKSKPDVRPVEKILVSREEAAALCSVGLDTLDQWIKLGFIRVCNAGRRVLVPRSELETIHERLMGNA